MDRLMLLTLQTNIKGKHYRILMFEQKLLFRFIYVGLYVHNVRNFRLILQCGKSLIHFDDVGRPIRM